ncbi:hypothetical protein [Caballeronia insecticola]|uniref:hypothetical protein n=1 Tax=Caballeronia insecticola TaxID=758793 RepID=UPI0011831F38|nr:hypothetical protein [Caballeronia insecticola]
MKGPGEKFGAPAGSGLRRAAWSCVGRRLFVDWSLLDGALILSAKVVHPAHRPNGHAHPTPFDRSFVISIVISIAAHRLLIDLFDPRRP